MQNCFRRFQMKVRSYGIALLLALCIQWLAPEARLFGQAAQDPQGFQRDYTAGPSWFPSFYRPYQQQRIGPMILENSRRIASPLVAASTRYPVSAKRLTIFR